MPFFVFEIDLRGRLDYLFVPVLTVGVAQLVRALGCGPRCRGFESRHSPQFDFGFLIADFGLVHGNPALLKF
jgi:hypothetical protein